MLENAARQIELDSENSVHLVEFWRIVSRYQHSRSQKEAGIWTALSRTDTTIGVENVCFWCRFEPRHLTGVGERSEMHHACNLGSAGATSCAWVYAVFQQDANLKTST
jgi:hypothetical protein